MKFLSLAVLMALCGNLLPASAVRDQFDALKTGSQVTITLTNHKKVKGSLVAKDEEGVQVRVGRAFFRSRTGKYSYADIAAVKKNMPAWVAPVVVLSAVGALCAGIAACVASGACTR